MKHDDQDRNAILRLTPASPRGSEGERQTDRLASIGLQAVGLGHDAGNLLLLVRLRLDALEQMDLPEEALEDIHGISEACKYLKGLCRGLQLFAADSEDPLPSGEQTHLAMWWGEVEPFMRSALPRGMHLTSGGFVGLPPVAMFPHALTQAIYNLVQNAGDARKGRQRGHVAISASESGDGQGVALEIRDDGRGMTEEVLRRCTEPFFTTKGRGSSTGLGLMLVQCALHRVGGSMSIHSRPGEGTVFRLTLPFRGPGEGASARQLAQQDGHQCALNEGVCS
jgi:signal transduction histidine kinase